MHRLLNGLIVSAAVSAALFAFASPAMADYISNIQANDTTGNLVEVNNVPIGPPFFMGNGQDPVVSALLSTPGTVNGRTYSNWSFLLNDGTGGVDIFASAASLSATAANYTPNLGDGLDIKGKYSPFAGIPEVGTITQVTVTSTSNALPGPVTGFNIQGILNDYAANAQTVTAGTVSTTILPNDIGGKLVTLDNVWLSSFGTGALQSSYGTLNQQYTLNDSSGGTCSLFYWPTSYSMALQNLYGQSINYGSANQYNMTGFLDYFSGTGIEFVPLNVTPLAPVPEPSTMALLGTGMAVAAVSYIRRKRRKSTVRTAQIACHRRH
jgi:hypothetical protein